MNGDRELDRLAAAFPRLFESRAASSLGHLMPGWASLVHRLCQHIDDLLDDRQARAFKVLQIKEKFGSLRFYFSFEHRSEVTVDLMSAHGVLSFRVPLDELAADEMRLPVDQAEEERRNQIRAQIHARVAAASAEAAQTCERCGRPGRIRGKTWLAALCDEHEAERAVRRGAWAKRGDGD